jgi:peptidoglycan/LPS O-acetylase OafA/YrhL
VVVLFHAGFGFSGGFVGVDVFFALSGYLITGLIFSEIALTGRLDLRQFFARRVRRLLPALTVMLVATLALSAFVIQVGRPLGTTARTALSATLFAANGFLYYDAGDYFSPSAEQNPLHHTWSLSVEEQFYLVMPLLFAVLAVALRKSERSPLALHASSILLLATVTALSLYASVAWIDFGGAIRGLDAPQRFAFYSPLSRAWEFGVGGLLALAHDRRERSLVPCARAARIAAPAGLALILASALLLTGEDPFPGLRSIPPVLGTLLLLDAGRGSTRSASLVEQLLSSRVMVWLGDISYSLYLWHWPFIVFAKQTYGSSPVILAAAVSAALPVARWSHRFVEQRFRVPPGVRASGARTLRFVAVAFAAPVLAVVALLAANAAVDTPDAWREASWSRPSCHFDEMQDAPWPREQCTRPTDASAQLDVLLIGDSHADGLSDGFLRAAEENGLSVGVWTRSSGLLVGGGRWADEAIGLIQAERPAAVVIAQRSTYYVEAHVRTRCRSESPECRQAVLDEWAAAVAILAAEVSAAGASLVWVAVVPEFLEQMPGTASTLLRPQGATNSLSREDLDARRGDVVRAELSALEQAAGAALVDPADIICQAVCVNALDGVRIYRDEDHLNRSGSLLMGPLFERTFAALTERADD